MKKATIPTAMAVAMSAAFVDKMATLGLIREDRLEEFIEQSETYSLLCIHSGVQFAQGVQEQAFANLKERLANVKA